MNPAPTATLRALSAALCTGLLLCALSAAGAQDGIPACVILDDPLVPQYWLDLGVAPGSDIEGFGDTAIIEAEGGADLYFWRTDTVEVDARLKLYFVIFTSSAGIDLPGQAMNLAADVGWTFRHGSGSTLQFRLAPGIYSDWEDIGGDMLNMPATLAFIQTFHDGLSGILGIEMRPKFERSIIPLFGIHWRVSDTLHVRARTPDSRVEWFLTPSSSAYIGLRWFPRGFALHDGAAGTRDTMDIEELRAYWGATWQLNDNFHLRGELNYLFARNIHFRRSVAGVPDSLDMDSAVMVRVGVGGPF